MPIPKNGGTTIINAFGKTWEDKNKDDTFLNGIFENESSKEDWIEYSLFYADYIKFSVIRNPWDRFISGWKYCESTKNKTLLDVLKNLPISSINKHDYEHITRLQYERVFFKEKQIQDILLRFENLQEDFDNLCEMIGKPKIKLNHLNKTERKNYNYYFNSSEKLDIFNKYYKKDIETFNYTYR